MKMLNIFKQNNILVTLDKNKSLLMKLVGDTKLRGILYIEEDRDNLQEEVGVVEEWSSRDGMIFKAILLLGNDGNIYCKVGMHQR